MIDEVAVIAGVALIATILVDMGLTVLHPTIRGPLSHRVTRLVWHGARGLARASRHRVVLEFAGPLVTLSLLATWIVGLWLGFRLVLVPAIATSPRASASGTVGCSLLCTRARRI